MRNCQVQGFSPQLHQSSPPSQRIRTALHTSGGRFFDEGQRIEPSQPCADRPLTGSPSITLAYTPSGGGGKAAVRGLGLTNKTFIVGKASTPLTGATTATAHKVGTTFSFRLARAATVKIAIQRLASGRRVRGVCRVRSAKLRHHPRRTRRIAVVKLRRTAHAGSNKVAFTSRSRGKALQPGNHRAVFTALDAAGASSPKTLSFTIAKH